MTVLQTVVDEQLTRFQALADLAEFQEPDLLDAPMEPIADLIELAEKEPDPPPVAVPAELPAHVSDERGKSLWSKIANMTVAQKAMLGFRGDKTTRMILVRDRNRMVCSAAMRNPRMTESEVEAIAGMRNVDEEVLRIIGMKRDWMQKYAIIMQLVHNPRAPIGVVMPLINRLTLRDLKGLKDDRGVTEVVRTMARKAFLLRAQKS